MNARQQMRIFHWVAALALVATAFLVTGCPPKEATPTPTATPAAHTTPTVTPAPTEMPAATPAATSAPEAPTPAPEVPTPAPTAAPE